VDDVGYYFFDRIQVVEWLQLLGGVRVSDYEESNRLTGATTFKDDPTSISYGAVFKPWSWMSIYGTYIEGLESTPAAPLTAVNASAQLPATSSEQREAGIKIEPTRGLLVQAAYFYIDRGSTYVNGANVYVQDGRARYKGTELSVTGEITSDLSLYASALFLDAKQESGAPTVVTTNANGTVTVSPTAVGKLIENSAKETWSIAGEYRLTDFVPGLSFTAGAYHTGRRAVNPLNQAFAPGYTLYDAGIAYTTEAFGDMETTFQVNGQNITNERYFSSTGGFLLAQGGPRMIKFLIAMKF
jgi:iron complex outermembrane receptor protein